jgi:hypothetical protein
MLVACAGGVSPQPPTVAAPLVARVEPATAPSAPFVAGVAAACRGAALDLDRIMASAACDIASEPTAPPPEDALGIELTPARETVAPGGTVEVSLALVNRTKTPMQLDLDAGSCRRKSVDVLGPNDERVDRTGLECSLGEVCQRRTVRIVIEPGGRARDARTVAAVVWRWGARCTLEPAEPMKPGTYRIRSISPVWDRRGPGRGSDARAAEARLVVAP